MMEWAPSTFSVWKVCFLLSATFSLFFLCSFGSLVAFFFSYAFKAFNNRDRFQLIITACVWEVKKEWKWEACRKMKNACIYKWMFAQGRQSKHSHCQRLNLLSQAMISTFFTLHDGISFCFEFQKSGAKRRKSKTSLYSGLSISVLPSQSTQSSLDA